MNINALLGIIAIAYAALVVWIALKKPTALWEMGKIKMFRKVLGEKGTVIFFYIWAAIALGLAVWLFAAAPIG